MVIYDTLGIHRAKPIETKGFAGKSIFFQIDRELQNGEKTLANTAFLDNVDEELKSYLGFGQKGDYQTFPNSNAKTLGASALWQLQKDVQYATIRSLLRAAANRLPDKR